MLSNVVVIVGSAICLIPNDKALMFGRFVYGLGGGGMSVFVPKFISETSPTEYAGAYGNMTSVSLVFGLLLAALVGLPAPTGDLASLQQQDAFMIHGYYRIVLAVPILLSVV